MEIEKRKRNLEALVEWLHQNQFPFNSIHNPNNPEPQLRILNEDDDDDPLIVNFPKSGWGLQTVKKEFKVNDVILRIPLKFLMTFQTIVVLDPQFREVYDILYPADRKILSEKWFIALYILYQKYDCTNPFWKPYIDSLPTVPSSLPLFWTPNERSVIHHTSLSRLLSLKEKRISKIYFQILSNILTQFKDSIFKSWNHNEDLRPNSNSNQNQKFYSKQDFVWAIAQISSRAFWHFDHDQQKLLPSMLPFGDMMNHALLNQTVSQFYYDQLTSQYIIKTKVPIPKLTEMFITYNSESNLNLILGYGMYFKDNVMKKIIVESQPLNSKQWKTIKKWRKKRNEIKKKDKT